MKMKKDSALIGYVFGILSIVFAFFKPDAGIVLGIIGIVQSNKEKSDLGKRAKKLSILGIVLSIVILAISIAIFFYSVQSGNLGQITNFPLS